MTVDNLNSFSSQSKGGGGVPRAPAGGARPDSRGAGGRAGRPRAQDQLAGQDEELQVQAVRLLDRHQGDFTSLTDPLDEFHCSN